VVCKICGWHAKRLSGHLHKEHGIDSSEYNNPVLCETSKKKYEAVAQDNGNWIEKAKARGEDLAEYRKKMGKALSESIISNPEDRKRRAKVMAGVNKSEVMRKKASETAKKTSAREDVQEKRAAQLKRWRDENPDKFFNQCTSRMLRPHWHSKPESLLYDVVSDRDNYKFKQNQVVKSNTFISKSKRKQVDIGDKSRRVYIEYDGKLHFIQTRLNQLQKVQEKDRLLDEHIKKHSWVLIRVGYDQFSYRKSDYGFKKKCLDRVFGILDNPTPGVHYIGEVYVSRDR